MFKKKISSGDNKMEVLGNSPGSQLFPKGTKFVFGHRIGTIIECTYADNTQMRRVVYDDGTDEIITLKTLLKDSESPTFKLVEPEGEDDKTGSTD